MQSSRTCFFSKHLLHFAIFHQHPVIPLGTKPAPARSAPQMQTQEIDFKLTWTIALAIQQRTDGDGRVDESTGNRSSSIGSRQDHCTNGKAVELVPTRHKRARPLRSSFKDISDIRILSSKVSDILQRMQSSPRNASPRHEPIPSRTLLSCRCVLLSCSAPGTSAVGH